MTVHVLTEPLAHAVVTLEAPGSLEIRPAALLVQKLDAAQLAMPGRVVLDLAQWEDEPAASILEVADALRAYWAELELSGGELLIVAEPASRLASLLVDLPVVESSTAALELFAQSERLREGERRKQHRTESSESEERAASEPEFPSRAGNPLDMRATPRNEPEAACGAGAAGGGASDGAASFAPAGVAPSAGAEESQRWRKSTVRYFKRMTRMRTFPVLVRFSDPDGAHSPVAPRVVPAEAREFDVPRRRDTVTLVPRFPGCLVVPESLEVDLSREPIEAQFDATPLAAGEIGNARIEVWYEGRRLDLLATPYMVRTQGWSRALAILAVLWPVVFALLDGIAPPTAAPAEAWLAGLAKVLGESYFVLGLLGAGLFGGLAALLHRLHRPRHATPVHRYLNWSTPPPSEQNPTG